MNIHIISDKNVNSEVAVIIPVFNGAKYLAEQCQALGNQSFEHPIEIYYVDNGSTDESVRIIKQQKWPGNYCVKIIYATEVKGQVYARNIGVEATSAKYLLFTDQDDLPQYDWVRDMEESLKKNQAVGGRTLVTRSGMLPTERCDDLSKGLQVLWGLYPIALGTNFGICKQVLQDVGGWKDIGVRAGEDLDLCIRLNKSAIKICYVATATVIWRARLNFKGLYKQGFTYGQADVLIYKMYGSLKRSYKIKKAMAGYFQLFLRLCQALIIPRQRKEAMHKTGWLLGRTVESIRQKILYI